MTYAELISHLKTILDEDLARGGTYRNFRPKAIEMILNPALAAHLFPSPIDGFQARIQQELTLRRGAKDRYAAALYGGVSVGAVAVGAAGGPCAPSHRDDIALADLCDAIADHTYAQLRKLPYVKAPKPADEMERATAFVTGVYTVFAILCNNLPASLFRDIYDRSWNNYFTLYTARAVRETYDAAWQSKYSHAFYPLMP